MAALLGPDLNFFRVLGDLSHVISVFILIVAIHRNKSAEGVSLITQALYLLIFVVRYLDLLWTPPSLSYWNFCGKIFYITSASYILMLMLKVYARTREREKAWKLGAWSLAGSLIAAPIVSLVFEGKHGWSFYEIHYSFTLILEAFCILPQLLLLRQTTVPTVIDSYYLVALGGYRFLYIGNWIVRAIKEKGNLPYYFPVSVTFGIIQTLFYFDFAWVYWTRQRVKLRAGALVDSQDYSQGWLVNKIIGHKRFDDQEQGDDDENEALAGQEEGRQRGDRASSRSNRWGSRGISVSADEGVHEAEGNGNVVKGGMTDPDAFEDDFEEAEEEQNPVSRAAEDSGVSDGNEWREGRSP